ncbi:hypothetical protein NUU61_007588 [Penicillium alfredii]|uniref:Ubiquitin carboxyl-terminal hydrolase n=1 Tax=Penicillium alfredii TaxID=1506179 RepID=A0A9W9JYQ0_9EURO|nr:uncharacterized protein NUU61_007588 [Penicillium alfredii]KAJ5086281.1 hypothetical protein NUU61_007588 [Penicillium alfredii]
MSTHVQVIDGRKTFIPLENNPEVLSHLCHNLGVAPTIDFHDVVSTAPDMLTEIPRPVHAIILLCDQSIYYAARSAVEPGIEEYRGFGPEPPVLWVKQTIRHSCGLMALLHCVLNLEDGRYITPGSELDAFQKCVAGLMPTQRAQLLYESTFLEEAHMDAALRGCSVVPSAQDECRFHFVAFVKKDGTVWELNGGMNGPFHRGTLGDEEDLLCEKGLKLTVKDFLDAADREVHQGMSIVALTERHEPTQ